MDNKTQLNRSLNATVLNSQVAGNSTVINRQALNSGSNAIGEVLDGKYALKSKMNISTGEADLYICTDGTGDFVAKIYRRNFTYLNNMKIPQDMCELHDGDEIGLGGNSVNGNRQQDAAYFQVRIGSCM